jgi:hypothetical protein
MIKLKLFSFVPEPVGRIQIEEIRKQSDESQQLGNGSFSDSETFSDAQEALEPFSNFGRGLQS